MNAYLLANYLDKLAPITNTQDHIEAHQLGFSSKVGKMVSRDLYRSSTGHQSHQIKALESLFPFLNLVVLSINPRK